MQRRHREGVGRQTQTPVGQLGPYLLVVQGLDEQGRVHATVVAAAGATVVGRAEGVVLGRRPVTTHDDEGCEVLGQARAAQSRGCEVDLLAKTEVGHQCGLVGAWVVTDPAAHEPPGRRGGDQGARGRQRSQDAATLGHHQRPQGRGADGRHRAVQNLPEPQRGGPATSGERRFDERGALVVGHPVGIEVAHRRAEEAGVSVGVVVARLLEVAADPFGPDVDAPQRLALRPTGAARGCGLGAGLGSGRARIGGSARAHDFGEQPLLDADLEGALPDARRLGVGVTDRGGRPRHRPGVDQRQHEVCSWPAGRAARVRRPVLRSMGRRSTSGRRG